MADKILSLESIKKCMEKIKGLLSTKVSVAEQPKENNSVKLQLGDAGDQLYFHGSTSPNIPVLKKKKTVKNPILTHSTIPYMALDLKDTNAIVLSVTSNMYLSDEIGTVTCRPFTGVSGTWYSYIEGSVSNNGIENKNIQVTVYYLEIPTGYTIPEDTTTSSDETEDDEGFAPQADFSNEESANYEE